jgi:hypothetical protein
MTAFNEFDSAAQDELEKFLADGVPEVGADAFPDVADVVIGADDDLPSRFANDVSTGDLVALGPGTHEHGVSGTSGQSDTIFSIVDDNVTLYLAPGAVVKLPDGEVSDGDNATMVRVNSDGVTIRGDGAFDANRANNSVSGTDDFEIVRAGVVDDFTLRGVELRGSPGKTVSAGGNSTQASNINVVDTEHVDSVEGVIMINFDGLRFVNNELRGMDEDSVEPVDSEGVVVANNTIKNSGREAVDLFDGNIRAVVANNVIRGVGQSVQSPAISVAGSGSANEHVIVANNTISGVSGNEPAIGVGVEFTGATNEDVLISDNEIDHSKAYKIQAATDVRVEGGKHSSAVTIPLEVVDADASAPIHYDGPQLAAARRLEFVPAWVDVAWGSEPIAEQVNASLSHRFRTLSDSDWQSVDGGSSFTFSLSGSPQTLEASHDGSGGDTYGHLTSLAAVDPADFDTGFRVWFRNVTFTENNGDNELYVGITDTPGSGGSTVRNSGALFYLTGGTQIFRVDGDNNGFGSGFDSGDDFSLQYDGSSVALNATDSGGPLSVSFSRSGPFTPVLMVKDASGNTQSETLACERVELEPL